MSKYSWKKLRNTAAIALLAGFLAGPFTDRMAQAETTVLDAPKREAIAALPTLRGSGIEAQDLENRVVVVAFFASWCPPCNPEFDHLEAVRTKFDGEAVEILAVNIFESFSGLGSDARLQSFLDLKNPGFKTLGKGEEISADFGTVSRIPSVFVFDRKGALAFNFVHAEGAQKTHVEEDELTEVIEKLL
ncbi:TlpA disulfide reductase family protein [Denitrobaculum tricleocarpae]|uniref:TlpA family protein disulfide reductase n=1 Tax=Denitrobaculum tricleocarpae TaxID=2591009 RepID=A0A545TUE3_9PROT|nr:TlpA disulfide reductase family protein [Denitrobaculum tricleocarpae]TQV80845.1 TlpA family protein disulfide reductase [Denitrobaculum tricleocarpae]